MKQQKKIISTKKPASVQAYEKLIILIAVTLLLAGLNCTSWGPFSFLPPVLSWPLIAAALIGWWFAEARCRGFVTDSDRTAGIVFEAGGLTIIFGSYLLLKIVGLHPSGTDDNIYFYMAQRMASGAMPYRDFFFVHPPVHLLIPAAVFSVTGFSIGVAKSIPALAQAVAGLFLYLTVRKASRPFAVVALLLHLSAYEVLMGSTDMNGENILTAFLMAALFTASRGRFILSGCLAGLGLGSGLYGLAAVLALACAAFSVSRRELARYTVGLAVTFGALLIVFSLIGGSEFWKGVFLYHLSKAPKGTGRVSVFASPNPFSMAGALVHNFAAWFVDPIFKKSLYFHAPSYVGFLIGAGLPAGKAFASWLGFSKVSAPWHAKLHMRGMLAGSREGLVIFSTIAVLLFMLQFAALSEVHDYYTVPMIVLLAIPASYALLRIWEGFRDARSLQHVVLAAALAAAFCMHILWAGLLNKDLWPAESVDSGKKVTYQWREPWALSSLSGMSRMLFFAESRVKGAVTPYYQHYVWNKMLTFSTVNDIAEYIRSHTAADETITGASIFAPLIALQSGRQLAVDEADTNSKPFSLGIIKFDDFFNRCCSDRIRYIVSAEHSLFDADFMGKNSVMNKYFVKDKVFSDPQLVHFRSVPITLYRRIESTGLPDGKVCLAH